VAVVVGSVRWGLQPLDSLTKQIGVLDATGAKRQFVEQSPTKELQPVYTALKAMLERIEATIARERAFADAAAHELRTPLAELRAIARWRSVAEPQRTEAALRDALAIAGEMERLVESLLQISRAAVGKVSSPQRIAPIVDQLLSRHASIISSKRLRITSSIDPEAALHAGEAAMRCILGNLIDNAVSHTPAEGSVAVRIAQGRSQLLVRDRRKQPGRAVGG